MKAYIVFIPVDVENSRDIADRISDKVFEGKTLNYQEKKEMIISATNSPKEILEDIQLWSLADFTELCNDENFDEQSFYLSAVYFNQVNLEFPF